MISDLEIFDAVAHLNDVDSHGAIVFEPEGAEHTVELVRPDQCPEPRRAARLASHPSRTTRRATREQRAAFLGQ